MDNALNSSGGTRIDMMNKVADSAKRFGSMLEQRQINRLIELASGTDERTLVLHVADRLSWHKRPRRVHLVATLPRNAMGKVEKSRLTSMGDLG